ncbi:MAG: PHP domain-containing protein, partial [Verrucomicrobiia bacterium]
MPEPLVYETHMHTPLCKHAEGEPMAYAEVAEARGLKGIIVTCHCPLPNGISSSVRMSPELFPVYVELVEQTRERMRSRLDVCLGLESDYLPGLEPWLDKLHQQADFHYILGSVHPQIPEYRAAFFRGNWPEFHRIYFGHLAEAAETGLYDCLAHPDVAKNLGSE